MKKLITSRIFSFILGAIIFSGMTVFAYSLSSKDIKFTPTNSEWQVENVEEAVNSLYEKQNQFFSYSWCCSGNSQTAHHYVHPSFSYFTITAGGGTASYTIQLQSSDNVYLSNLISGQKYDFNTIKDKKVVIQCTSTGYKCFSVAYTNK